MQTLGYLLLAAGFVYVATVSTLACRESGRIWMLFLPQWIAANKP